MFENESIISQEANDKFHKNYFIVNSCASLCEYIDSDLWLMSYHIYTICP